METNKKTQRRGIFLVLAAIAVMLAVSFATILPRALAQDPGGGQDDPNPPINRNTPQIWDGSIAPFAGGNGTAQTPYLISNGSQLAFLAMMTNSALRPTQGLHFALTNDIYLNDISNYQNWGPAIGAAISANVPPNHWIPIHNFAGVFDGRGHSIKGLYQSRTAVVGLFQTPNLTVINRVGLPPVTLQNFTLSHSFMHSDGNVSSGAIIGTMTHASHADRMQFDKFRMNNVHSDVRMMIGAAMSSHHGIGGLIGRIDMSANNGTMRPIVIHSSSSRGSITLTNSTSNSVNVGGLVGSLFRHDANSEAIGTLMITNSMSYTDISVAAANDVAVGGLIGGGSLQSNQASTFSGWTSQILNSHNRGNISLSGGSRTQTGGLIGSVTGVSNIVNSSNTGNIVVGNIGSNHYAGGLVGRSFNHASATTSNIHNSYNSGNIALGGTVELAAGGIIGANGRTVSVNNVNTGAALNVRNSQNSGNIRADSISSGMGPYVGGIVGLTSRWHTNDVSGSSNALLQNNLNSGEVLATSPALQGSNRRGAGGIIGHAFNHSTTTARTTTLTIRNNVVAAQVRGINAVSGGIVGSAAIGGASAAANLPGTNIIENYVLRNGDLVNAGIVFSGQSPTGNVNLSLTANNRTFHIGGTLRNEMDFADSLITIDGLNQGNVLGALNGVVAILNRTGIIQFSRWTMEDGLPVLHFSHDWSIPDWPVGPSGHNYTIQFNMAAPAFASFHDEFVAEAEEFHVELLANQNFIIPTLETELFGWRFIGWGGAPFNGSAQSAHIAHRVGESVRGLGQYDGAVINLYPLFEAREINIDLDLQGGRFRDGAARVDRIRTRFDHQTNDAAIATPIRVAQGAMGTRVYSFRGFRTGRGGTGTLYINAAGQAAREELINSQPVVVTGNTWVSGLEDTVLYADWALQSEITFSDTGVGSPITIAMPFASTPENRRFVSEFMTMDAARHLPTAPGGNPTRAGQTFIRWEGLEAHTEIIGRQNFVPVFAANPTLHTITFMIGGVPHVRQAYAGQTMSFLMAGLPGFGNRGQYVPEGFLGWGGPFSRLVAGNVTLTANFMAGGFMALAAADVVCESELEFVDFSEISMMGMFALEGWDYVIEEDMMRGRAIASEASIASDGYDVGEDCEAMGDENPPSPAYEMGVTAVSAASVSGGLGEVSITFRFFNENYGGVFEVVVAQGGMIQPGAFLAQVPQPPIFGQSDIAFDGPVHGPLRAGYRFVRWSGLEFGDVISGHHVFYAVFAAEPVEMFSVNFEFYRFDGWSNFATSVPSGSYVSWALEGGLFDPNARLEYVFLGWEFLEGGNWLPVPRGMVVNRNLQLRAVYIHEDDLADLDEWTVRFLDGDRVIAVISVLDGMLISAGNIPVDPIRLASNLNTYQFDGWTLNGGTFNFNSVINGNIDLTARFVSSPRYFAVRFIDHNGDEVRAAASYRFGHELAMSYAPSAPIRAGFTFIRWDGFFGNPFVVTSDHTFVAVFALSEPPVDTFTVTFERFGQPNLVINNVLRGTLVSSLFPVTPPVRPGHEFMGWEGYSAGMVVNANHVFTADFRPSQTPNVYFEVTIQSRIGAVSFTQTVLEGTLISEILPSAPFYTGYTFIRWEIQNGSSFVQIAQGRRVYGNYIFRPIYESDFEGIDRFSVSFYVEDGVLFERQYNVLDGSVVVFPTTMPYLAGHTVTWELMLLNGDRMPASPDMLVYRNLSFYARFTDPLASPFEITIGSNMSIEGNLTQALVGTTITVNTFPPLNQRLVGFISTPSVVFSGSGNNRTFVMPASDISITAVFEYIYHNISIIGGTTNISQARQGESVSIILGFTPPINQMFASISITPFIAHTITGTGNTRTVTFDMPTQDVVIGINFDVFFIVNITEHGSAAPAIAVPGTLVTVTFNTRPGFNLTGYTGNVTLSGTGYTRTFIMPNQHITITPVYEAIIFDVSTNAAPASGGTISANLANATAGQIVLLNLTINAGYAFNPATGFVSSPDVVITPTANLNQFSFVMPASNVSITANFVADQFDITVNTVGNGTVAVAPNVTSATMGTTIVLTAHAELGSQFNGFTAAGILFTNVGANQYSFDMPANDVVITANFGLIQYAINTVLAPISGGSINIAGSITTASIGTAVYFSVAANALYEFDGLSALSITGGVTITQPTVGTFRFVMPANNVTITVNFVRVFNITVNAPNGTLNRATQRAGQPVILTVGTIPVNHTLSITSTPVVAFTGAGGSGSTRTFTMPTSDVAVTVTFIAPNQHAITTNANPIAGGSVVNLSALSAILSETITFNVNTNAGFNFNNVTVYAGLTPVAFTGNTTTGFSFTMPDAPVVITANFNAIPFDITALAGAGGSITALSATSASIGTTVTFVAAANAGFERTSVTVMTGATAVSVVVTANANEFSFVMPAGNVTINAEFIAVASTITINVMPGTGGSVLSSHTNAIAGTTITLTVNASALYEFDGFIADGITINQIGATNQFEFIMPVTAVTIEANFVRVFNITIGGDIGGTLNVTGAQRAGTQIIVTLGTLQAGHEYLADIVSPMGLTYSLAGNQLSFDMPSDNVVINISSQVQTFRVEFTNGGVIYFVDGVEYGTLISSLNFNAARAHLVYNDALVFFTGWNLLGHGLMPSWPNTVNQNLTFQANFSSIMPTQDEAVISFYVDGSQVFTQTVYIDLGTSRLLVVSRPANPANWSNNRYNFTFDRWVDQNNVDWADDRLIEGDMVFTAVFISSVREFDIRFEYLTAAGALAFEIITLSHDALIYGHTSIPNPPVRADYTFIGWQGLNEWTRVTGNMTFVAMYVYSGITAAEHRVIFLNYNGTVQVFNQLILEGTMVSSIKPSAPNRIGFTFVGWLNYVPNMQVTSDLTFIAVYIEDAVSVNNADVVFYMLDGVNEIELARFDNVLVGTLITSLNVPTAPTRAGYTFVRWQGLQSNTIASAGLQTFRAIYVANAQVQNFTVTFVNYDSTPIASISAVFGTYISWLLPANPSRADASYVWIFEGWELHLGGASWAVLSNQTVSANHTLRAYFMEDADWYSVTWVNHDGNTYRVDAIRENRLITNIPILTKDATIQETFNFVGWFIQGTNLQWNFATDRISGYLSLEARFIGVARQYTINFVVGTTVVSTASLAFGDAIWPAALAVGAPTAPTGYVFSYWRGLTPNMTVAGEHNFFAVFRPIDANVYTIRFLNNNAVVLQHNLAAGALIVNHLPVVPTRVGYIFSGWLGLTGGMVVTGHHDFEAVWTAVIDPNNPQTFTLRFFDEDGTTLVLEMTDIAEGTLIAQILPAGLIRANKEFIRWDKMGALSLINGGSRVEGNTDFIAVFGDTATTQRFTIEFVMPVLHGGAVVLRLENVLAGTYINSLVPTIPNVAGHDFIGWQGLTISMLVTSNHTFIAQFEARQLQIIFNASLADSLEFNSSTVTFGGTFGTLPNAVRAGHLFVGWFTAPNGMGSQIFSTTIVAFVVNTTLHAAWSNQSVIVFDSNGGSNIERLEGAPNSAINPLDVAARVPNRLGHNFLGWFEVGAINAFAFNYMPHDMGNPVLLTLYARWEAIEFSVVYNINIPHANSLYWGDMDDSYFNFGTSGTLRTNAFNVYGWIFAGWSTNPNATTAAYSDNAAVFNWASTEGAVINLYAVWQASRHLVTFNYHGATGGAGLANTFVYFDAAYGALPNPTRAGYAFVGWFTEQAGGVQIESTTIVSNNAPHMLHARWEELQLHSITVVGNGFTDVSTAFAGDEIILTLNIPTGYVLIDIVITPNITLTGTGDERRFIMPNEDVNVTIEVQSIALIQFDITINNGTAVASAILNTLVVVTFNTPAYGYMIAGFTTTPAGLVLTATGNVNIWTFVMPAADVVITPIIVPIDTNTNSATITSGAVLIPGNTLSANFIPGQVVTIRVNNPPMGLIFDDFTLVGINALTPGLSAGYWTFVMPNEDVFITVNWTEPDPNVPVEVTVTFVFNGADNAYAFAPDKQVIFGQVYGALPVPSRQGFTFSGWQTVSGAPVNSETIVSHTINHTLIAQWTPLVFNVTITNATGTGEYTFGTRVEISLIIPDGFEFIDFINLAGINRADIHFDAAQNVHWFIMPASNVEITVSYAAINLNITINGGWAADEDGNTITTAVVGQRVILNYNAPIAGYRFRRFISFNALAPVRFDEIGDFFYIIMPAGNVSIAVDVEEAGITTYWLNIFGATGVGRYAPNDMVVITLIPPFGQTVGDIENYAIFEGITFQNLIVVPGQANTFIFVMPAGDVRIDFRPAFILAPAPTFTITIDGGSYLVINGNEDGYPIEGSIIRLTADAALEGYRFMRFDTRDVVILVDAYGFYFYMPNFNVTLNAVFERLERFNIVWVNEDGSIIQSTDAMSGTIIVAPSDPVSPFANRIFVRWDGFVPGMAVIANHIFVAIFESALTNYEYFTITWNYIDADGNEAYRQQTLRAGQVIIAPANLPLRANYVFVAWQDFVSGMIVTGNHEFYAIYVSSYPPPGRYVITWFDADGVTVLRRQQLIQGSEIIAQAAPRRDGYTFSHWDGFVHGMRVVGSHEFTAVFVVDTQVLFNIQWQDADGNVILSQHLSQGVVIIPPAAPIVPGYVFILWQGFTPGMTAQSNYVFVAQFERDDPSNPVPRFTITWIGYGGVTLLQITLIRGALIPVLPAPNIADRIFLEWAGFSQGMTATADHVFVAVFVPAFVTVTFDSNGGTGVYSQTIAFGSLLTAPDNPIRQGHIFVAWYIYGAENGTETRTRWDFNTPVTGDMILVAEWQRVIDDGPPDPGLDLDGWIWWAVGGAGVGVLAMIIFLSLRKKRRD